MQWQEHKIWVLGKHPKLPVHKRTSWWSGNLVGLGFSNNSTYSGYCQNSELTPSDMLASYQSYITLKILQAKEFLSCFDYTLAALVVLGHTFIEWKTHDRHSWSSTTSIGTPLFDAHGTSYPPYPCKNCLRLFASPTPRNPLVGDISSNGISTWSIHGLSSWKNESTGRLYFYGLNVSGHPVVIQNWEDILWNILWFCRATLWNKNPPTLSYPLLWQKKWTQRMLCKNAGCQTRSSNTKGTFSMYVRSGAPHNSRRATPEVAAANVSLLVQGPQ